MSVAETVGLALAAGVAAEATGVTDFTGDRGSENPPVVPTPQIPVPQGPDTAAIIEAFSAGSRAASGGADGPDVGSIIEAVTESTAGGQGGQTVVNVTREVTEAVEEAAGEATERVEEATGRDDSDGSSDDGPIFDLTREGPVAAVGMGGQAVEFTDDPTGLVRTGEDIYNRVNEFGDDMTDDGELGRVARRIVEGENPVAVVNEEGDGPISNFTRWASSGGDSSGSSTSSSSGTSTKKSTGTKIEERFGLDNITAPFQTSSGRERQRERERKERRSAFGVL